MTEHGDHMSNWCPFCGTEMYGSWTSPHRPPGPGPGWLGCLSCLAEVHNGTVVNWPGTPWMPKGFLAVDLGEPL